MSTNTTIAQEIDENEDNVSAINSSNEEDASDDETFDETFDPRVLTVGCIVKLPVCDVFDEWTGRRNGIKDVYGVTEYIEDRCETTGQNAWHIMWYTCPYKIATETYDHLLPVAEDDLQLVKDTFDDPEDTDPAYITTYFQKKANG